MPRGFGFDDRAAENQQRLLAYDRLDKTDLSREKFNFEQAMKTAEAERKASESAAKVEHFKNINEQKDQRLQQFQQQLEIQQAKEALAAQQAAAKNDRTIQVLGQATEFLKGARGMDPSKPQFDEQFQNLSAAFPMAFEHPAVKEWTDYHRPLREKFVASGLVQPTHRAPDTYEKFNSELKAMVDAYGGSDKVPQSEWQTFERRKAALAQGGAVPLPQPTTTPQTPGQPVPIAAGSSIKTKEDYDALPPGAEFEWNGKKGRKP